MFKFARPEYLQLLFILPVMAVLFIFYLRNKKQKLLKLVDAELFDKIVLFKSFSKEILKFSVITLSSALLILAMAKPQMGSRMEEVKQVGIDIFILLDVSNSMRAEDVKPDRLTKAKFDISNLIRKLEGDRIGLIVFAGESFVQFPLTTDYSAATLFLNAVDHSSIPVQGTAIADAIDLAVDSFSDSVSTQKAIIVMTDGEDHEGDIESAIEKAKEKGVYIYTIGMGTEEGAPIPIKDVRGNTVGYKDDSEGNTVVTKINESILREIASKGDGKFYRNTGESSGILNNIYDDLSGIEKSEYGSMRITQYDDKYHYFLIPALLLLILEIFITDKPVRFLQKLFREKTA